MDNQKMRVLMEAVKMSPPGMIVEIGCIREEHEVPEDGFSTVYLAKYAKENGLEFRSFDNEQPTVDLANRVLEREGLEPVVECKDGVQAIKDLGRPIAFLYLDSHRHPKYSKEQFHEAEKFFLPNAIVAIDDTHEYEGHTWGKATDVILYVYHHRWEFDIVPTFKNQTYETGMTVIRVPELFTKPDIEKEAT